MSNLAPPCLTCGYPQETESCEQCLGQLLAAEGATPTTPGRGFFMKDLAEGFFSLFHASLQLMTRKEFIGKLTLAVFVNVVLFSIFVLGILWAMYSLLGSVTWPFGWLETTAEILLWPLSALATWFLAPPLINAGMTPFLDPIANATEKMVAGPQMKPVEIGIWRGILAGANAAAQVLVLQVFVLVPVMILSLIPVVGIVFLVFGILFSAYLNGLVWLEIPVLRRGYGWSYRRLITRHNWARSLGLGLAFNLGMLAPVFNLFFLGPATAVAVSTLYFRFGKAVGPYRDAENERLTNNPRGQAS